MKFCVDCKWHKARLFPNDPAYCLHPELGLIDLVTGKHDKTYCRAERRTHRCGPDALLFEAKEK